MSKLLQMLQIPNPKLIGRGGDVMEDKHTSHCSWLQPEASNTHNFIITFITLPHHILHNHTCNKYKAYCSHFCKGNKVSYVSFPKYWFAREPSRNQNDTKAKMIIFFCTVITAVHCRQNVGKEKLMVACRVGRL